MTRINFLFLCFFLVSSTLATAQEVFGVRVGEHTDKTRIVFEVAPGTRYSVSTRPSPPQLLVDFTGARWQGSIAPLSPKSGLVAGVQQAPSPAGGQLFTLAFKSPGRVQSAFVLPAQGNAAARLVIDVVPDAAAPATQIPVASSTTSPASPVPVSLPATAPSPQPPSTPVAARAKPLIVIDPGHGGKDPGAISRRFRLYEKNVVLQLSRELRAGLQATGRYRVHLTRDSDIFIPLQQRPAIAQKMKADLFLSVHADSAESPAAVGASIYTLSKNASDRVAARLAAKENRSDMIAGIQLEDSVDAVTKSVLLDLMQRDTMNMSSLFADLAARNLRQRINTRRNPHGYAGFMVLLAPDVPSALLESGFLSNPTEEQLLNTPAHRQKIVQAMVKSVDEFFQRTQSVNR